MTIEANNKEKVDPLEAMEHCTTIKKKKTRRRGMKKRSTHCDNYSTGSSSSSSSSSSSRSNSEQRRRSRHEQKTMDTQTYIAMDCEMVGVGEGGRRSMLARVTLVNWNGEIVYDEFVKPTEEVTDYRTFVSGVTAESLDEASLDIQTVRRQVIQLLESKILVGHALKNDLHALNIHHLWQNTRDTAKYQPFQKVRFDDGILWPRKLKDLCLEHLGLDIQRPGQPHSSYQDAVAALALYKMVRPKWEKVMQYKIQKTAEIEAQQNRASVARTSVPVTLQLPQPVLPIASAA